jgi:hypothetical protein
MCAASAASFTHRWLMLLRDATMAAGGHSAYEASIFNVESFFGWTLTSAQLQAALAEQSALRCHRIRSLLM